MTEGEANDVFRRWVAEYYEIPLARVAGIPQGVYASMSEVVLEDMERRLSWDHSDVPWPDCVAVGCPRHGEEPA